MRSSGDESKLTRSPDTSRRSKPVPIKEDDSSDSEYASYEEGDSSYYLSMIPTSEQLVYILSKC